MDSRRLASEYARLLRKERVRIFVLKNWYRIVERLEWFNFGRGLMLISIALISAVGFFILIKSSFQVDIPVISLQNSSQIASLGQVGDFFGGILNPLLSFMALLGVLYTIRIQGHELKEAREENRIANKIQDKQTAVFERQNFESVFFRLIDVHARLTELVRANRGLGELNGFGRVVEHIFEGFYEKQKNMTLPNYFLLNPDEAIRKYVVKSEERNCLRKAIVSAMSTQNRILLSQYFRNIYQILKLVDSFKVDIDDEGLTKNKKVRRLKRIEYFQRRQYCNILRAQLSDEELKMLFFNCLTESGEGLKFYLEKYSLLKHLDKTDFFVGNDFGHGMYDVTAFADYEDISDSKIMEFASARVRTSFRHVFPRHDT